MSADQFPRDLEFQPASHLGPCEGHNFVPKLLLLDPCVDDHNAE